MKQNVQHVFIEKIEIFKNIPITMVTASKVDHLNDYISWLLKSLRFFCPFVCDAFCISSISCREEDGAFCKNQGSPRTLLLDDITTMLSIFRTFQYEISVARMRLKFMEKIRGSKMQSGWLHFKRSTSCASEWINTGYQ